MSGVVGDIKKLFKFKFKARSDGATDQYHRLFMTRALLVGAFLTGLNWYKDDVKCIVPKSFGGSVDGFGPKACWINGFYVYKELKDIPNFQGYYGLPNTMAHNGTLQVPLSRGDAARSTNGGPLTCAATEENSGSCKPMEKLFYLQYQWFPFYLATIALLYYIPYIMFQFVNTDLLSFKKDVKNQKANVDGIIKNYFNRETNQLSRQHMRVVMNIIVKFLYIMANVCVLSFTDSLLNNDFIRFGSRWMSWSELRNDKAHNYVDVREHIKPGERLLPTFGFCDVLEAGLDIKHKLINEYSLVCEISQHVLYHYVLIAIWILIVVGFVLSCLGFLWLLLRYGMRSRMFANEEIAAKQVYDTLSVREAEYLDFARKKNVPLYGTLIRALHKERYHENETKPSSPYMKNSEF